MVVGDQDGSHINANVSHPNVSKPCWAYSVRIGIGNEPGYASNSLTAQRGMLTILVLQHTGRASEYNGACCRCTF